MQSAAGHVVRGRRGERESVGWIDGADGRGRGLMQQHLGEHQPRRAETQSPRGEQKNKNVERNE